MLLRAALFHLLLFCASQVLAVNITSDPGNIEGVIHIDLKRPVSLVCTLDTQPDEELVWLRNDAVVRLEEGNKKGRSTVCVTPIHDDNGATFTCYQKGNSTIRASVTLNVIFAPNISGSEEVTVEEEGVLVLECDIRANPLVSSVTWTLNGTLVDLQGGHFTVINDGLTSQLKASKVEKSLHEGMYQCTVVCPMCGEQNKLFQVTTTGKTFKFPQGPIIAGVVVVALTALLAVVSRWKKIAKCCK